MHIFFAPNYRRARLETTLGFVSSLAGFFVLVRSAAAGRIISALLGVLLVVTGLTLLAVATARTNGNLSHSLASGMRDYPFLVLAVFIRWLFYLTVKALTSIRRRN